MGGLFDAVGGLFGGSVPKSDPAIAASLREQAAIGKEAMNVGNEFWADTADDQNLMDYRANEMYGLDMATRRSNEGFAGQQRGRYQTTFAPIEDRMAQESMSAGGEADMDAASNEAIGSVNAVMDQREAADAENIRSMGGNPMDGASANQRSVNSINRAVATANASGAARRGAKDRGIQLRQNAISVGNNVNNMANQGYGVGLAAGTSAINNSNAGNVLRTARSGNRLQGYGIAMGGQQALASGLGQQQAQQRSLESANRALGASVIGTGIGLAVASDRRAKEDIQMIGKHSNGLNIYTFRYKDKDFGDGVYRGVMADEVEKVRPDCVVPGSDGFMRVNYAKLGMRMERVGD